MESASDKLLISGRNAVVGGVETTVFQIDDFLEQGSDVELPSQYARNIISDFQNEIDDDHEYITLGLDQGGSQNEINDDYEYIILELDEGNTNLQSIKDIECLPDDGLDGKEFEALLQESEGTSPDEYACQKAMSWSCVSRFSEESLTDEKTLSSTNRKNREQKKLDEYQKPICAYSSGEKAGSMNVTTTLGSHSTQHFHPYEPRTKKKIPGKRNASDRVKMKLREKIKSHQQPRTPEKPIQPNIPNFDIIEGE